nr:immunoglobulin heavy chain junction region [Mus musculus]MBK4197091.1 immunoglobulin heavy chain junction region [Mus musculus]
CARVTTVVATSYFDYW